MKRRTFLKGSLAASVTGVAVGGSLLAPNMLFAGEAAKNPYKATSVEDALKILGITTEDSDKVTVVAPDLAENAAVVPVEVKTTIEGAEEIHVFISNNPTVYAAKFKLGEGIDPAVKCRFKVGKTGDVVAVVKAGDKYYMGKKAVKVTKGGCGG
ncbi:MAG TPA: thiosulfate oxidation carrier protein SoxY [Leucothrix mucor]|uniref:Thiosulfate oxidation carrier protein SoxY n=1 Tax=Leucothrix mucor TaxID=45248 RepID=A0A7V2T2J9_LEUMU|nr:thiosulfate oxidation carrier protein SoxY [Leucothrix mucor]